MLSRLVFIFRIGLGALLPKQELLREEEERDILFEAKAYLLRWTGVNLDASAPPRLLTELTASPKRVKIAY